MNSSSSKRYELTADGVAETTSLQSDQEKQKEFENNLIFLESGRYDRDQYSRKR